MLALVLGADGGGEDQPVGMQLFREIPQEAVVGLPVPAIDILKVNIHAIVVLLHSGVHNVLDQTVAGRFIGEQPAGKAAVKVAALLDVGHHHDGPGAADQAASMMELSEMSARRPVGRASWLKILR